VHMEDYASAAARHWDNVKFLAQADQWQEAAYLAGYIAECSAKVLLQKTAPQIGLRPLSHNLAALTGEALELAVLINPASRRYPVTSVLPGAPGVSRWTPEHRYEKTAFLPEVDFQQIVSEAEAIGQAIFVELVLDGVIVEIPE